MDRKTIACAFLAIIFVWAGYVAGYKNYHPCSANPHSTEEAQIGSAAQSQESSTSEKDEPECQSPPWYTTAEGANWALVILGFVTFWVIGWQAFETRRAAEFSAIAAKAGIDSERAWVLLKPPELPEIEPYSDRLGLIKAIPEIENSGKTVARIVAYSMKLDSIGKDDQLPDSPIYGRRRRANIMLPPSSPISPMFLGIRPIDIRAAESGTTLMFIYGFIEYFDLGKTKRETRFCFQYVPEGLNGHRRGWYFSTSIPDAYTDCS